MKVPFYLRLPLLAALCLFLALPTFSQISVRDYVPDANAKLVRPVQTAKQVVTKHKNLPTASNLISADCDNDLTAPEIVCPAGTCLPNARAAYVESTSGAPWNSPSNIYAMDAVFGSGNWDYLNFGALDPNTLLSPSYKVIFLEGSQYGGYALDAFLTQNLPALENWVAAGGALFINGALVDGPSPINLGFDGVVIQKQVSDHYGYVQVPDYPIFNGPFSPANGEFTGYNFYEFQYGAVLGNAGIALLTGSGISLSVKTWGDGKVYFGCIIPPLLDAPQPNVQNMWQNILSDLSTHCAGGLTVAADAGACNATVLDQLLDATATDDCELVSLTHDFIAAPIYTTLAGAVLPPGKTIVRWTATDATGNTSTCETLLLVRESEAPVITCQQDISVNADAASCGAVVAFSITVTDNCTLSPTINILPAAGSLFSNGTTTVYATATDESYNTNTCSFTITVAPNPEVCNGLDDDCNGIIDDGATGDNTFYRDYDGDGYGDPNNSLFGSCPIPYGYVFNALDCDDTNYYTHPNASEYCNGIDDNCNGIIDEGVAPIWYADTDGDGYGDPNTTQYACNQPQGFVYSGGDCDDTNAYIHPGALEDCTNLIDENCDGILGENNFTIDEIHTDVYCGSNPDGTIHLTLAPLQNYPVILWSNHTCCTLDLTNLDFGTYKVTVTNECGTSKTKTVIIQPSAEPALQVSMTGTEFICGGASDGSVSATPSDGCGGYTYEWNTGSTDASISGLIGGDYTVIVTDACGCTRAANYTVNQPAQLNQYFASIIPLLDGTYFVQVIPYGGTSPYKFRRSTPPTGFTDWSSSNGFLGVPAGDYMFEVEDGKGCIAQVPLTLAPLSPRPLGTEDGKTAETALLSVENRESSATPTSVEQKWAISLFPNPNAGSFTVDLLQSAMAEMSFGITDQKGRLLLEKQVETGSQIQMVNAEILPAGLYFLQVIAGGKVVAVEKFVKE